MYSNGNSFNTGNALSCRDSIRTEPFWFHQMGFKEIASDEGDG